MGVNFSGFFSTFIEKLMMNNINDLQNEFVRDAGLIQFFNIYNLIPDVMFWVKDMQNRFIFANEMFLKNHGVPSLNSLIGKCDFDLAPLTIANQLKQDDDKILGGQPVIERMEISQNKAGETICFLTSKRPVFNQNAEIMGTYVVARHVKNSQINPTSNNSMQVPVDYIKANFKKNITIEALAELAHLSVSAFQRRFKKQVNKTPWQLLTEMRMKNARRLLIETDLTIAEVGHECGLSDHSYFSKQFKNYFGMLPSVYRQKNQTALS